MEKDLETLLGELETAAWNQGHALAEKRFDDVRICQKAVEEAKQEIRDFMSKDD